ncbi:MAG: YqgE/AlgH family protein [Pseudomonadota bacterium]|nr:YqgE/AlgH family protein [Pseudomonadota bacterium]
MRDEPTYLTNQFLIAMPGLADPNFFHTVTYICEHNAAGALGIVINRPLNLSLGELLAHLKIPAGSAGIAAMPVFSGGPVHQEQGFVVHTPLGRWESTLKVTDAIGITTSRDVLQAMALGQGPEQALIALGYAGWGEGQLEQEMVANAWLSGPATADILFHTPVESRWTAAAALLGVDLSLLSGESGHA